MNLLTSCFGPKAVFRWKGLLLAVLVISLLNLPNKEPAFLQIMYIIYDYNPLGFRNREAKWFQRVGPNQSWVCLGYNIQTNTITKLINYLMGGWAKNWTHSWSWGKMEGRSSRSSGSGKEPPEPCSRCRRSTHWTAGCSASESKTINLVIVTKCELVSWSIFGRTGREVQW